MAITFVSTADIGDIHGETLRSCDTQFINYGGHRQFCGKISTVRAEMDNALVKKILNSPNEGGVLVIEANANMHTAMVGDLIAGAGVNNGWAGIIVHGAIRDADTLGTLAIGVKALGSNPRKSAKDGAGEEGVTVSFGGIDFVPGEYVYADGDGVVVSTDPVEAS